MLDLPTATLLLGIATLLVTGYIAIQQWLTARRKLRLDVFDRRLPVFEDAMSFTEIVSTKEKITLEVVQKFKFATKSVQFLFNRRMQDYCDNLYTEAYCVWSGKQKIDSLPEGEERDKSMGLWQGRRVWFNDQRKEIPKRFARFLKIRG